MPDLSLTVAHLIAALGVAALKATAILALATLATRLLRRRAAALRHLVWTTALGSAVAVLVLPIVLPAWHVLPVPALSSGLVASSLTNAIVPAVRSPHGSAPAVAATSPGTTPETLNAPRLSTTSDQRVWPALVLALWLAGVAVVLCRYVWGSVALRRLAGSSTEYAESGVLVDQMRIQMGITRPVSMLSSDDVELPLTWGIFRPRILLPRHLSEWTPECRRHVLWHELAHVRRLDAATQLVAQAASALFWFHPLVWYAVGQMRRERERACDDRVLVGGAVASQYAGDLLALVTCHGHVERYSAGLAFARRSHFEGRLLALLDPAIDRRLVSPRRAALVVCVSLGIVVPLAAIQGAEARVVRAAAVQAGAPPAATPVAALTSTAPRSGSAGTRTRATSPAESPPAESSQGSAQGDRLASATLERRSSRPTQRPDIFAGCAPDATHGRSVHDHVDSDANAAGRTWTTTAEIGGCRIALRSEGQVVFNADASGIERLSPNGYFDVTTDIFRDVTHLIVRASADGGLTYDFSRNGQPAEFSAGAGVWLEQFLVALDRITAFAIDNRFPALFGTGGPDFVLAEVDAMHTDHAKTVYLLRLIQSASLDGRQTVALLSSITGLGIDSEKARVLTALATADHLDADARAAYEAAAGTIGEPQTRARALRALTRAR